MSCFSQLIIEQTVVVDNYLTEKIVNIDKDLPMDQRLNSAIDKVNSHGSMKR